MSARSPGSTQSIKSLARRSASAAHLFTRLLMSADGTHRAAD